MQSTLDGQCISRAEMGHATDYSQMESIILFLWHDRRHAQNKKMKKSFL